MHRTILRMLEEAARDWPDEPYLLKKTDQGYVPTSFRQAAESARFFSAWLTSLGFKPGETFALFGDGSPEWVCAELGMLGAGLISVPLSNRLTAPEFLFRMQHSDAAGLAISHNHLEKALNVLQAGRKMQLLYLDEDIDWAETCLAERRCENLELTSYKKALADGKSALEAPGSSLATRLDTIHASITEDTVATISYTSGTTGRPKGIMLTHLNYWANCHDSNTLFDNPMHFRMLLMLPADHSFTHTVAIFTALTCSVALYFVDARGGNMAMLRNILKNMQEAQPMLIFTVPALSGNFMKKICSAVEAKGPMTKRIFDAGIRAGMRWNGDGFRKPPVGDRIRAFFPYFFARIFVFGKVKRQAFGRSIRFCVSGGAMLDLKQQQFFAALGVPVYQGYGLTEAAPVISSNIPRMHKLGTAGVIAPTVSCSILDESGQELPAGVIGEITIIGENVMAGYFREPDETAKVLRDGRLWTGDLGYFDEDGFLVVVGRKRALLIGEDGEKYSPEKIEEAIASSTEVIDQIMTWCIYRKYVC
ncbi:MAG: AMP-binding protein, partial [Spirochaetaceae bacterium]|nr:AMP-binding protein [Spirochaetaceae bacterium]